MFPSTLVFAGLSLVVFTVKAAYKRKTTNSRMLNATGYFALLLDCIVLAFYRCLTCSCRGGGSPCCYLLECYEQIEQDSNRNCSA